MGGGADLCGIQNHRPVGHGSSGILIVDSMGHGRVSAGLHIVYAPKVDFSHFGGNFSETDKMGWGGPILVIRNDADQDVKRGFIRLPAESIRDPAGNELKQWSRGDSNSRAKTPETSRLHV